MDVKIVDHSEKVERAVHELNAKGYTQSEIYVFSYDKYETTDLKKETSTQSVGMKEQGFFEALSNVFRSRWEEIEAKIISLGVSPDEASRYENELEAGKIVLIAKHND
ncbi:general stress protein [Priestia koreensis]|uniref:general stress protein n=1 Tax=Priestia koreensis TaxID=284581 RepID=UPI001F596D27|nr:general stress protein [Priestia koreensis]UNL84931.1 general stress protein [Priestia koreensis]